MKKTFKAALAIVAMLFSLTNVSTAQQIFASNSSQPDGLSPITASAAVPDQAFGAAMLVAASAKIMAANPILKEKLAVLYPAASGQQWATLDKGFYVSFLNNGIKSSAAFTTRGTLKYAISNCTFQNLPSILRDQIAKKYSGYTVLNAIEINAYQQITYQVVLENAAGYVTLKSNSDTVEKVQQVAKSK